MFNKNKRIKGFTLVELLVASAVFMSVMVIAVGSLVSIISQNKRAESIKSIIDNITVAVDSISRGMRNGMDYKCLDGSIVIDCPPAGAGVIGVQYKPAGSDNLIQYRFVPTASLNVGDGNIQRRTCNVADCSNASWQSMTAPTSTVNISNMNFYVLGINTENLDYTLRKQPRVVITAEGYVANKDGTKTDFTLQTTASQRFRNEIR
jgi:type II secretory pathway pseudopilin PulG